MISILIPIYNYEVGRVAKDLLQQCQALGKEYEIILADDGSTNEDIRKKNKTLLATINVNYIEVKNNIGRSKIRNFLAKESKGDMLLFLDCDSGVVRKDFVSKYLYCSKDYDVVSGGTIYCEKEKVSPQYLLHWTSGKEREEGKKHFTTNNFLIKKEVFEKVCFDESIKGYGHEDTILGEEMREKGYRIGHIDNPVEHLGLKTNDKFISDISNASKNLALLYKQEKYKPYLENITLIKAYKKIRNIHCNKIFLFCFKVLKPFIFNNLKGKRPNIKLLDMVKLYSFITIEEKENAHYLEYNGRARQ
ncbi:MAG: glycosyltransferase family A protein [Bacteroidota bacterium]|nr:glycosyltransferase family A protein [Bacteroidota bacterium]